MAIFTHSFTPNTSTDGADLLITDDATYGGLLSKSVFTGRSIVVTKSDATTITYSFPYTGTADNISDVKTITDYFDKDYIVNISLTWSFSNEGTADTEVSELDYLSNYNSIIGYVNLADSVDCNCDSEAAVFTTLCYINNYIENAIYWAKFNNSQKAQKFLDKVKDIVDSLDDCN